MQDQDADQSAHHRQRDPLVQASADTKRKKYCRSCLLLLCPLVALTGCHPRVEKNPEPGPVPPKSYTRASAKQAQSSPQQWWQTLDDHLLRQYIEEALHGNFSLKQGLARLKQAGLLAQQVDADRYPSGEAGVQGDTELKDGELDFSEGLGLRLTWEADLWGRLTAAAQAARLDVQAEREALSELSLALTIEVAETYYALIEQTLLLNLLQRQLETDTTTLELVRLRFANGTVPSTDVLQQEELLASVKAQVPPIQAQLAVLRNRLLVLLGHMPEDKGLELPEVLPELPPLPWLGIPADLLLHRPDLRRLQQEVAAADYRVAKATAERLPSLKLGASAGLNSGDLLLSLFAEALAPLVDWEQKKNEVERQRAKVEEKMAAWSQAYLEAVAEVENSLHQEEEQGKLLMALQEQLGVAESLLEQTRNRYLQGVSDYLPVLSALVSVQNLERSLIRQQRVQLSSRLQLYHALGGSPLPPLPSEPLP